MISTVLNTLLADILRLQCQEKLNLAKMAGMDAWCYDSDLGITFDVSAVKISNTPNEKNPMKYSKNTEKVDKFTWVKNSNRVQSIILIFNRSFSNSAENIQKSSKDFSKFTSGEELSICVSPKSVENSRDLAIR